MTLNKKDHCHLTKRDGMKRWKLEVRRWKLVKTHQFYYSPTQSGIIYQLSLIILDYISPDPAQRRRRNTKIGSQHRLRNSVGKPRIMI